MTFPGCVNGTPAGWNLPLVISFLKRADVLSQGDDLQAAGDRGRVKDCPCGL
jgi:hypothetical protein